MNVPEFLYPRKERGFGLYLGAILVLTAVTSFGLGRLSATEPLAPGLRVVYPDGEGAHISGAAAAADSVPAASSSGQVVASKSGTKYHLPSCPGAAGIKEENRIYFANRQEAEAAGYEPAANCKGLQ